MRSGWFLQDLMTSIADQGRNLLPAAIFGSEDTESGLQQLIEALTSNRGEASGVVIARQLLRHYRLLEDDAQRSAFFRYLARRFQPDTVRTERAAAAYLEDPSPLTLEALQAAVESPLQEFFRRLNLAPGGTAEIVHMREDLLRLKAGHDELERVDRDMVHLLHSWFNRGFLVLRPIDWQTPAAILDKIIEYEAVHAIQGWQDLRRRLEPNDRRCFAFFHPSMGDEPLIFVEVALMSDIPATIQAVLEEEAKTGDARDLTTAVFYSISNCQAGLRGISFGNFLIKQVVEDLLSELPNLKTFVTLSPVPRFASWLSDVRADPDGVLSDADRKRLDTLDRPGWFDDADAVADLQPLLLGLASHYFLEARSPSGRVIDPVGRFHLGNGARLERVNMTANPSPRGLTEAHGLMVNYLYDPAQIERNHEAFANEGTVAVSRPVRAHLKALATQPSARAPAKVPAA
ncbi:MAG: malonyl-CoA decarboxylase [Pseudomonadota bacterium]